MYAQAGLVVMLLPLALSMMAGIMNGKVGGGAGRVQHSVGVQHNRACQVLHGTVEHTA